VPQTDALEEIESGSVLAMVDASSALLLSEMNEKSKKWKLWPWLLIGGLFLLPLSAQVHEFAPLVFVILWAGIVWWVAQRDALRLTTVLVYDLDTPIVEQYQKLHDAFDHLMKAGRVGHVAAKGGVTDRKRHAGASTLLRRQAIRPHKKPPARVSTNVEVPAIPVGNRARSCRGSRVYGFAYYR
jgi:hypothetical protein